MVVGISNENQYSYFYILNPFPNPIMTLFDSLFLGKVLKIGTWNFNTNLIQVLKICYQNLEWDFKIVWKLCGFRHHSHFENFQQFFHTFRLKEKFQILIASSERSASDLSDVVHCCEQQKLNITTVWTLLHVVKSFVELARLFVLR